MNTSQLTPDQLWWIGAGVAALVVALMIALQKAAYRNGACDGYGYAREAWNPGYRRAGEYLRETMIHRWPELKNEPIEPMSGTEHISDFFDARPVPAVPADGDGFFIVNPKEERRGR